MNNSNLKHILRKGGKEAKSIVSALYRFRLRRQSSLVATAHEVAESWTLVSD